MTDNCMLCFTKNMFTLISILTAILKRAEKRGNTGISSFDVMNMKGLHGEGGAAL